IVASFIFRSNNQPVLHDSIYRQITDSPGSAHGFQRVTRGRAEKGQFVLFFKYINILGQGWEYFFEQPGPFRRTGIGWLRFSKPGKTLVNGMEGALNNADFTP